MELTLDKQAANSLPASQLQSGIYKPTNYGADDSFPAPAPALSGKTDLSAFDETNPNGTWKLFKQGSTTKVGAVVSYSARLDRAILNPNNSLQKGATYKAVVTTYAKDKAGNRLDQKSGVSGLQQKVWYFKTAS